MKQHHAAGEDHQRTVAYEAAEGGGGVAGMGLCLAAMSPFRIDLSRTNDPQRDKRRGAKSGSDEEDCLVRDQVASRTHSRRSKSGPDGSEPRVASKPLRHGGMAD